MRHVQLTDEHAAALSEDDGGRRLEMVGRAVDAIDAILSAMTPSAGQSTHSTFTHPQHAVFRMRWREDMTLAQIASEMGISVQGVAKHLDLCNRKIQRVYGTPEKFRMKIGGTG